MVCNYKHPLDIEGMNYKHNDYFWWPYGKDARTMPKEILGKAVCIDVVFFRIEEIDYRQLLKDCIDAGYFLPDGYVTTAIAPGFEYLNLDWNTWEDIEADNMFFCNLFWSVYLHMKNYDDKARAASIDWYGHRVDEDEYYNCVDTVFERIMTKNNVPQPYPWFFKGRDYLPAYLEKYGITAARDSLNNN